MLADASWPNNIIRRAFWGGTKVFFVSLGFEREMRTDGLSSIFLWGVEKKAMHTVRAHCIALSCIMQ